MVYLKLVLLFILPYFIGYPIYRLITFRSTNSTREVKSIILSYAIGLGLLPLLLFYLSFVHIQLSNRNMVFLFIPWLILTIILKILSIFFYKKEKQASSTTPLLLTNPQKSIAILMALIILASVLFSFILALSKPLNTYDALFHWAYKAKILFYERTIYSSSFTDLKGEIVRIHKVPSHSLLVPMLEFYISAFLGNYDERMISIIFPIFFLILILFFIEINLETFSLNNALLSALFLVSIPFFYYQRALDIFMGSRNTILSGNADLPLAFFYLLGSIQIYLWINNSHLNHIIMAGLFSSFAAFTKNEGIAYFISCWIALFIIVLIYLKGRRKEGLIALALYGVVFIVLIAPWIFHQTTINPEIDSHSILTVFSKSDNILKNISQLPTTLFHFFTDLIRISVWGLLWPLFFICLIMTAKMKKENSIRYLSLILLLHFLIIVIALSIMTPPQLKHILRLNVISRLLFHAVPIVVFFSFYHIFVFMNNKNAKP